MYNTCMHILFIFVIFVDVVRANNKIPNCTEIEVVNFIKSWLVRSKDRNSNYERGNKETEPLIQQLRD